MKLGTSGFGFGTWGFGVRISDSGPRTSYLMQLRAVYTKGNMSVYEL